MTESIIVEFGDAVGDYGGGFCAAGHLCGFADKYFGAILLLLKRFVNKISVKFNRKK